MTKKVIIVGPAHPFRGGIAQYNNRLAQEFTAQGYDVSIYTFSLQYPKILFPGKTQYSDSDAPKGIKIYQKINSINPFNWIKVGKELRNQNPDLVVFRYWLPFMAPCLGTISKIIQKNKHSKCVAILDNVIPHEKRAGDVFLTNYFIKHIQSFLVMSKTVEKDLRQFTKGKPCVFNPHPLFDNFGEIIDKQKAKSNLNLDVNTRYILFFGLIRDYKGLDLLLKAFNHNYFTEHNIKLIVAGEFYGPKDKYSKAFLKLADSLILHDKFIPDEEVKNYFCASDLVVQPYKSATQSGISQIAYHFNKPMIVTNVGGLPELVPHNIVGLITEVKAESIQKALIGFYENDKELDFVENIKSEKLKFSWDKLTEKLLSLIIS